MSKLETRSPLLSLREGTNERVGNSFSPGNSLSPKDEQIFKAKSNFLGKFTSDYKTDRDIYPYFV